MATGQDIKLNIIIVLTNMLLWYTNLVNRSPKYQANILLLLDFIVTKSNWNVNTKFELQWNNLKNI